MIFQPIPATGPTRAELRIYGARNWIRCRGVRIVSLELWSK